MSFRLMYPNKAVLRAAEAAWPSDDWDGWHRYQGRDADKYASLVHERIPPACIRALHAVATEAETWLPADCFIDYSFYGAGLHMLPAGGHLQEHTDAEFHPIKPWRRRYSIVCFLDDFEITNGGRLVLQYDDCREEFTPQFGTSVMFETQDRPHWVTRVADESPPRRTLALFAWSRWRGPKHATHAQFKLDPG